MLTARTKTIERTGTGRQFPPSLASLSATKFSLQIYMELTELAFLTLCDLALNPPFLGGKMIELGKFCFIKTKCEPNLSCFSK